MALFYIAYLIIGLFQIAAGMQGIQLYFGVGAVFSFFIFMFSFCIPVIGTMLAAIAVYYGARYGWRWEWWQALLFAAPGLVLMAIAGVASAFSRQ